ncbi:unnamed protein product [marine sediment metagenome]|uniref:DUF4143 domain-containing protein n=1 Tax=marine sediment metagenome TaxID=412755 RepID=X1AKC2_9ZZZZ
MFENFVLAELEKRRKLGFIKTDRFFYYKTKAGREIDLIFESENQLYAIEIKSTQNPSKRDINNLIEFEKQLKRPVQKYLFYSGTEYSQINQVHLLPVACLHRGI